MVIDVDLLLSEPSHATAMPTTQLSVFAVDWGSLAADIPPPATGPPQDPRGASDFLRAKRISARLLPSWSGENCSLQSAAKSFALQAQC
jgi:hypothetical protein